MYSEWWDNLFIYLFTDLPLKTYKTSRFDITKEQRRLGWKCHTEISSPITGFQITHTRYTNTPHTNYYTYKLHIQVTQTLNKRSNIQRWQHLYGNGNKEENLTQPWTLPWFGMAYLLEGVLPSQLRYNNWLIDL